MPPLDDSEKAWFEENLRPHESMIRAWLQSRYGSLCDVDDVIQETYLRVFEARKRTEVSSPKAFFFAVARNAAVDQIRRSKVKLTESCGDWDDLEILDEAQGVQETVARNHELELLTRAIQQLPDRCRRVFTLSKVYGLSYEQIAQSMGISIHTVSAQLTKGTARITAYLRAREGDR